MTEHSKLPPSSASRRVACPGSRRLEELYPEDHETEHAREGHAAHWLASEVLKAEDGYIYPSHTPEGEPITEEMIDGARLYRDHIWGMTAAHELTSRSAFFIEERLDISSIHPDCWGTPDCWVQLGCEIHVWDYKFGHGFVEVFENWQLIEYAAGIVQALDLNGLQDQHTFFVFHVIQPRSYDRHGPIRSWKIRASDLRGYFNILRDAENLAALDSVPCVPNPECRYCLGRHACVALQRQAYEAVDLSILNTPLKLTPTATGVELKMLKGAAKFLDARITGLEEQAKAMLTRGDRVQNFALEQGYGRENWKIPAEEVVAFGELMGIDLKKPVAVITPKQAIKAGLPEEPVKGMTVRSLGAMKLVADDGSKARKIFGGEE